MSRPLCCVYIAASVDGFIAGPGGDLDWLKRVERPGEDYGFAKFFDSIDTLLLGRRTYDFVRGLGSWPYGDKRCVVLTHRPEQPLAQERFFAGEVTALVDELQQAGAKRVYVDGGEVIAQFLAAGLIDDLTISQIPVLLGGGTPLFRPGAQAALELVSSRAFPSGLVQSTWRLAPSP